jgi:hypothetical protein
VKLVKRKSTVSEENRLPAPKLPGKRLVKPVIVETAKEAPCI